MGKTEDDPDENIHQQIPVWRLTNATTWNPMHSFPITTHVILGALMPIFNVLPDIENLFNKYAAIRACVIDSLLTLAFMHLMPFFFHPWRKAMRVFVLCTMLPALITLFAFHTAHLADFLEVRHVPGVDWGEHQLRTTANFKAGDFSPSGTLDLQVEHHLFPFLSYENQRAVRHIVQETAAEFGIPYHNYDSILEGFYTHMKYMVVLAKESV